MFLQSIYHTVNSKYTRLWPRPYLRRKAKYRRKPYILYITITDNYIANNFTSSSLAQSGYTVKLILSATKLINNIRFSTSWEEDKMMTQAEANLI